MRSVVGVVARMLAGQGNGPSSLDPYGPARRNGLGVCSARADPHHVGARLDSSLDGGE